MPEDETRSFEKDYFVNSSFSNYKDYRKRKFNALAGDLIKIIPLDKDMKILDFGCATGGLLSEFKKRRFHSLKGTDISEYAITWGREKLDLEKILDYYNLNLLTEEFDIVFFLDVLEHVPKNEIHKLLKLNRSKIIVLRVPVSAFEGEHYVLKVSRNDQTHIQCHPKKWWIDLFKEHRYVVREKLKGKYIYDSKGVLSCIFIKD